ncbi:MAG: SpvB/TcaC N-terminal domain-containing protein [Nostoc sp. DedQUE12a]|nr:SpvB/TcaC N-terminal domain-containing protein [Nostoc sp. DedQUE12a]
MLNRPTKNDSKQTAEQDKNYFAPPQAVSLPKGGGAIKGMGEKFAANPVTGTASLSVPIFTTPCRGDFYPQLSLAYDSGAGNGSFGFGWMLSIPSVARKTEKGLPRYRDAEDSDVFILSEAEDLVPLLVKSDNKWIKEVVPESSENRNLGYIVQRYRPRIEGLFARIERWQNKKTGEIHWKSISKDNIIAIYGKSNNSRIADPSDSLRVFKWLLCESYDDKGNRIIYEYEAENLENVERSLPQEKHRLIENAVVANRYIKFIKYGNQTPGGDDWLFQVVFDYGEHDREQPQVTKTRQWQCRPDAFSSFRPGFEVRTYRLCQKVLMFHNFPELGDKPCLVRSTDFTYRENSILTCLIAATQTGYVKQSETNDYFKKLFPPLEFTYTEAKIDETVRFVDLNGDGHTDILISEHEVFVWYPSRDKQGFEASQMVYQGWDEEKSPALVFADGTESIYLADMDGDGLVDIVRIRNGEVCYWSNLGYGRFGAKVTMDNPPWFDHPELFDQKQIRLADIDGSGTTDIFYLKGDEVSIWLNQSGNSWSKPYHLKNFPKIDDLSSVTVVDLLGNGTACLVWSSSLPGDFRQPMRYIDLMGGQKPYLMVAIKNNMGAIRADNMAALATYLSQGFGIIGTAKRQAKINSRYIDEIIVEKFL